MPTSGDVYAHSSGLIVLLRPGKVGSGRLVSWYWLDPDLGEITCSRLDFSSLVRLTA